MDLDDNIGRSRMLPPLPERMRPHTLDGYVGQKHLVGEGGVLRHMIETGNLTSFILWGPPGVGKTTLARIVARNLGREFYTLSAVSAGVKEVREVIDKARSGSVFSAGAAPILFIDEIHRFNKAQQDALLGAVEDGTIVLVGATTENPSFEVNTPLLSRCQVFVLKSLEPADLQELLDRTLREDVLLKDMDIKVTETEALFRYSGGDARKLLNILEMCVGSFSGDGPRIIDNKTSFQLGVIYATRSGSEVLARTVARFGDRDTLPHMLVDATQKHFAYAEDSWGWWFLYNSEKRYREGIADWRLWASRVTGEQTKQAQVYNVTTSDIVEIMNWAIKTMEYTLGVLNDDKVGHFYGDNVIYYVKGISRVVDNIIEGLLQCDSSIIERGGKENVDELLKRLHMISQFNPIYVVGGSYGVGDSFWPNHIAAMARHIDVVSNRLTDIRNAMEK